MGRSGIENIPVPFIPHPRSACLIRVHSCRKRVRCRLLSPDRLQTLTKMRLPIPKFVHPPEIYRAIIREHQESPLRMGEVLMACGWTIGDAAWTAVNWDLQTLAAAIAHERAKRHVQLTMLSEEEVAELKKQIQA